MDIDNLTIIAIGALVVAAISVVLAIRKGGDADRAVTVAMEALAGNREAMERYERAYSEASATTRQVIDALAGIVRAIAPLTRIGADDKAADVLEDIRTPGPPPTTTTTTTTTAQ